MAERNRPVENPPETVINNQSEKPAGFLHSVLIIFLALLVVAVVSFGVFYFFVKNNINGLADTLRPQIKNIPILNLALPKEPVEFDPDDPKYLTEQELVEKYEEYREKVKSLNESLDQANKEIEKLTQEALSLQETEATLSANKTTLEAIEQQKKELGAIEAAVSELVANGDKDGFKQYFEKVDKATAEAIYKEVVEKTIIDEEMVKMAKPFAGMEPRNAAVVLSELYSSDSEAALDIFEGLKADALALILESMDAKVAADIVSKLAQRKTDL